MVRFLVADVQPAWSPEGQRLAYVSQTGHSSSLYLINADGGGRTALSPLGLWWAEHPAWSPDGQYLAFVGRSAAQGWAIYRLGVDSGELTRLAAVRAPTTPTWAPDGQHLAFVDFATDSAYPDEPAIYSVDATGHTPIRLSPPGAQDEYPAWSPDGQHLAFVMRSGGLSIMDADGRHRTRLTQDPKAHRQPHWAPDGQQILFLRGGELRYGGLLYQVRTDGQGLTRVPGYDEMQDWAWWIPPAQLHDPACVAHPAVTPLRWQVVPAPTMGGRDADQTPITVQTTGVAVRTAEDIWTVGGATLAHWDGQQWAITLAPIAPADQLQAVSAAGPHDVWAVGMSGSAPLAVHWDGQQWRITYPAYTRCTLRAVAARAADDVWAVGDWASDPQRLLLPRTLIEHWDGQHWSIVPSPSLAGQRNELWGVSARGVNDVWAVGTHGHGTEGDRSETLIEHWDGQQWRIVPSPSLAGGDNTLTAVAATSGAAWAVGIVTGQPGAPFHQPLILQWTGGAWRRVPGATLDQDQEVLELTGVAIRGPDDVWAVGYTGDVFVEHWDGQHWQAAATPWLAPGYNHLLAIGAGAGGALWAVGAMGQQPLVERYSGP